MFPTLLSLGPVTLPTYGVMLLVAFAATLAWTWREARMRGLDAKLLFPGLAFFLFLGAVLGGRLALVPANWDLFLEKPWTLFIGWRGAQSSLGSALFASILAAAFLLWKRQPVLTWMDAFAPGSALGAGLLRLGCFSAGCCFGQSCDLPWAVTFSNPGSLAPLNVPLHPTQLYASAAGLLTFVLLIKARRWFKHPGRLMGLFLCCYCVYRFLIDFLRADHEPLFGKLSFVQLALIAGFTVGQALLLRPTWAGTPKMEKKRNKARASQTTEPDSTTNHAP